MHLKNLSTDVREMYQAMCLLAYEGLQKDKMVFSKEEREAYHSELTKHTWSHHSFQRFYQEWYRPEVPVTVTHPTIMQATRSSNQACS